MWPIAEKMAGLFSPRSTARRSSRRASSGLPSRCKATAVAKDRERPPFSSAPSPDPLGFEPIGFTDPGLPTTAKRGEAPRSTGFRFTELIATLSFLISRLLLNLHRLPCAYDSFGTSIEHSLPRKSLFFVIFIQYTRAFSLPSAKNPTPPDFRRSSLHVSTSCPSIDVRNRLPFTSTSTRYGRLLCIITCSGVSPRDSFLPS